MILGTHRGTLGQEACWRRAPCCLSDREMEKALSAPPSTCVDSVSVELCCRNESEDMGKGHPWDVGQGLGVSVPFENHALQRKRSLQMEDTSPICSIR